MKKHAVYLIAIGSLVVLLAGAALAQDDMGYKLRAEIPFEFYAGATTLPAGVYTFDVNPGHVVTVMQDSTSHSLFLIGMPADPVSNDMPVLTFKLVGSEYQLRELQSGDFGVALVPVTPLTSTAKTISAIESGSMQGGQP